MSETDTIADEELQEIADHLWSEFKHTLSEYSHKNHYRIHQDGMAVTMTIEGIDDDTVAKKASKIALHAKDYMTKNNLNKFRATYEIGGKDEFGPHYEYVVILSPGE